MSGTPNLQTFNKNNQYGQPSYGYHQRVIFSFAPSDFLSNCASDAQTISVWNVISDTLMVDYEGTDNVHPKESLFISSGGKKWFFPPQYWQSGKTVRIKGRFYVDLGSGTDLNLCAFIEGNTVGQIYLGYPNGSSVAYHTVQSGKGGGDNVVDFELNIRCSSNGLDGNYGGNGNSIFSCSGFYQYNYSDPITNNNAVVYVPVFYAKEDLGVNCGTIYNDITTVGFNFSGGDMNTIEILNLTIEELA